MSNVPAARIILAALGLLGLGACVQQPRPAPVSDGIRWATFLGNPARTPFAHEQVSESPPTLIWSSMLGSAIRGMPAVTDETVVAATADRYIHAVDRLDGSVFWRDRLAGPPVAPLVLGEAIFTATEDRGRLRSMRLSDGDEIWERRLPSVSHAIAAIGDTIYAATDDGSLFAIAGGREPIWRAELPRAASAGPLVVGNWVVYVSYDSLFAIRRGDGQRRTAASHPEIFVGEAASDGEVVYLATERGSLTAWSLPDLELRWQTPGFGRFLSGPVIAGEHGFAVTGRGQLLKFRVADGSADTIGRARATVVAPPTVVRNGVLVGTIGGHLHLFSHDGGSIWEIDLEGSIEVPAAVQDGRIIVAVHSQRTGTFSSASRGRLSELR